MIKSAVSREEALKDINFNSPQYKIDLSSNFNFSIHFKSLATKKYQYRIEFNGASGKRWKTDGKPSSIRLHVDDCERFILEVEEVELFKDFVLNVVENSNRVLFSNLKKSSFRKKIKKDATSFLVKDGKFSYRFVTTEFFPRFVSGIFDNYIIDLEVDKKKTLNKIEPQIKSTIVNNLCSNHTVLEKMLKSPVSSK